MQIRLLFGPAGSGKTWQCLDEIRRELVCAPEGDPLIFIAPRQATFQLERQLLNNPELRGYSRLEILSFERLARFLLRKLEIKELPALTEQGRVMVLRAILNQEGAQLQVFGRSARRLGFAEELSKQIREFQNHGVGPGDLRKFAAQITGPRQLAGKLEDLAFVFERYLEWLQKRNLLDPDAVLAQAADEIEKAASNNDKRVKVGGLWLDGFAQLTPQERRILTALCGFAPTATLAFCLGVNVAAERPFSHSYLVSRTAEKCAAALQERYGASCLRREFLQESGRRFGSSADLLHLEQAWASPQEKEGLEDIELNACENPEAEAVCCARRLLRFVREGGRFREAAVLVRDFENDYPQVFRRVFQRYEIPFFLDHRESVAHHPLAELTRGAVRTVAYNWRQKDWFGTLKSGLVHEQTSELDILENAALARGWEGAAWGQPLRFGQDYKDRENPEVAHLCESLRVRLVKPFLQFKAQLGEQPTGPELACALRILWEDLQAKKKLELWAQERHEPMHETVWKQMQEWLEDVELAFEDQALPLVDWLPIIESGLSGLTVGVIPPALDQVLIGAVDRSRNPDLRLLLIAGLNETVFPRPFGKETLLTEADREKLRDCGSELADTPALRMAQEQFYGYIACTRPREKLLLTYARNGADGKALNPSRFVGHLQRLFPKLKAELYEPEDIQHVAEVRSLERLEALARAAEDQGAPQFAEWRERFAGLREPAVENRLEPAAAQQLYGNEIWVSVSSLEQFGMCPFRFFLRKGLRLEEREMFELDVREQGSFQHEVLAEFHKAVQDSGRRWRDLGRSEAEELIGKIARDRQPQFKQGLLEANVKHKFTAEQYGKSLQRFITEVADWFQFNEFDPEHAELPFGEEGVPPLKLELGDGRRLFLRGRMDRVDIWRDEEGRAIALVMDYKTGSVAPNKALLYNGVQQQLPGYLIALLGIPEMKEKLRVKQLEAGGCFYIPLREKHPGEKTRTKVIEGNKAGREHVGLFNYSFIGKLDSTWEGKKSGQFKFSITKTGKPNERTFTALKEENFRSVVRRTEELMKDFARRIFNGEIAISPYKQGSRTACDRCDYAGICRFDSWEQPFRQLERPQK